MNLKYQRFPYPPGLAGVEKTVQHMKSLISQGIRDPYVRALALRIIKSYGVGPLDAVGEAKAIYGWVKQNIRYTKDPISQELLQSVKRSLDFGAGDCDDFTILICALLGAIGRDTRIEVVGSGPQGYSHVYPTVYLKGQWVPLDATTDKLKFGERPFFSQTKIFNLGETMLAQVQPETGVQTLTVSGNDIYRGVVQEVVNELNQQFNAGTLTPQHLALYLESVPTELKQTPGMTPTMIRAAVKAVELVGAYRFGMSPGRLRQQMPSPGQLGDLSGFLTSIWKGVKKAVSIVVGGAAKLVGIDTSKPTVIKIEQPVAVPEPVNLGNNVTAQVVPKVDTLSGIGNFLTSPLGLGLIGFTLFALTGGLKSGRRRR